jgi:HAD superfamily hydrolase (TIGR01509 family)
MTTAGFTWKGRLVRGVVFDVDGTLIDSIHLYVSVFQEVIGRYGLECPAEGILDALNSGAHIWDRIPRDVPDREERIAQAKRSTPEVFERAFREVRVFPSAQHVLRALDEHGIALGVLTSSWRDVLAPLDRAGVLHLFRTVVSHEDGYPHKPETEGLLACVRQLGLEPRDVVIVGDAVIDLQAGVAEGTLTVAVLSGVGTRQQLEAESPDALIEDVGGLGELWGPLLRPEAAAPLPDGLGAHSE